MVHPGWLLRVTNLLAIACRHIPLLHDSGFIVVLHAV